MFSVVMFPPIAPTVIRGALVWRAIANATAINPRAPVYPAANGIGAGQY
jgi:hypothetical protein